VTYPPARLRVEPFPDVTLGRLGSLGQLGRGGRSRCRHRPVEPELVADDDQRRAHRRAYIGDHLAQKLLQFRVIHFGCHGFLLVVGRAQKSTLSMSHSRATPLDGPLA